MAEEPSKRTFKVLELFSGIGGMHFAVQKAKYDLNAAGKDVDYEIVTAMDISEVANKIYRHNFPKTKCVSGHISGLTASYINKKGVNAIFMSPPCQPYTRQGLQKDLADERTKPLVHIIRLLPEIQDLSHVLVENVKGFETSLAYEMLVDALKPLGFHIKTFLLNPSQLGYPNSRLRSYLLARKSAPFNLGDNGEILSDMEELRKAYPLTGNFIFPQLPLSDFLIEDGSFLLVEDKVLQKYAEVIDMVTKESKGSCCFTKSYGNYAHGTGSVIIQQNDIDDVFKEAAKYLKGSKEYVETIKKLKLRYFSPYEIAKLMGFPVNKNQIEPTFEFPNDTTRIHSYRVLGNSLNVSVVAMLATILLSDE